MATQEITLAEKNTSIAPIIHDTEITIPRWSIGKDDGLIRHEYGIEVERLQVAIIGVQRSRTMWPAQYEEGNAALCRSHNMVTPVDRFTKFGSGSDGQKLCFGCPFAEWKTDSSGKRIKPECSEDYNVLIVDLNSGVPGVLSLRRTRAQVGKTLEGFSRMMGNKNSVELWTEKEGSKSGKWYGLRFKMSAPFSEDDKAKVKEMADFYRNLNLSAVATPEESLFHESASTPEPVVLSEEARLEVMLRD